MTYQVCSPAEALHTSQEGRSVSAHRASQLRRSSVWVLATWNVRTLLDGDGSLEFLLLDIGVICMRLLMKGR